MRKFSMMYLAVLLGVLLLTSLSMGQMRVKNASEDKADEARELGTLVAPYERTDVGTELPAVAADAYVCQADEFKSVKTTRINQVITRLDDGWTATLTTVEVNQNGQFKFNILYSKSPTTTSSIYCPLRMGDKLYLNRNNGTSIDTRIDPIDQDCSYRRGTYFNNDVSGWAIFPGVSPFAMPLKLTIGGDFFSSLSDINQWC